MDLHTNIKRQHELLGEINLILDGNDDTPTSLSDAAAELAELVQQHLDYMPSITSLQES